MHPCAAWKQECRNLSVNVIVWKATHQIPFERVQILKTLQKVEEEKLGEIDAAYKSESDWLQDAVKSILEKVKLIPKESSHRRQVSVLSLILHARLLHSVSTKPSYVRNCQPSIVTWKIGTRYTEQLFNGRKMKGYTFKHREYLQR